MSTQGSLGSTQQSSELSWHGRWRLISEKIAWAYLSDPLTACTTRHHGMVGHTVLSDTGGAQNAEETHKILRPETSNTIIWVWVCQGTIQSKYRLGIPKMRSILGRLNGAHVRDRWKFTTFHLRPGKCPLHCPKLYTAMDVQGNCDRGQPHTLLCLGRS